MKRYRFAIAIILALFVGAIVALAVGNTLTGVLSGVLVVAVITLVGSLNWNLQRVLEITRIADFGAKIKGGEFLFRAWKIIATLGKMTWKYVLSVPLKMILQFFGDESYRKFVYYFLVFLALFFAVAYELAAALYTNPKYPFTVGLISVISTVALLVSFVCGLVTFFFLLCCLYKFCLDSEAVSEICDMIGTEDSPNRLFIGWIVPLEEDGRTPLMSTLHMLRVRFTNVAKMFYWCVLLVWWLPRILFTYKTAAATITATILSGFHLGISYWYHWIAIGSANFWLLLAICTVTGAWIGIKIHGMRSFKVEFPKIEWMEHLPVNT